MIKICFALSLLIVAVVANTYGQRATKRVKQPAEVIEAYRVCSEFQRLYAEDLDFERAFEATFTKDPARRRAIAIAESELGHAIDLAQVDDPTLIGLYKDQMQLLFSLLLLINSEDEVDKAVLLPPEIDEIYDRVRRAPKDVQELREYAAQLKRDVASVRSHLDRLVANNPSISLRVRKFKEYMLKELKPPDSHIVQPLTSYSKGKVAGLKEEYYQIDSYSVIRERGEMKIIGIRFFLRLF